VGVSGPILLIEQTCPLGNSSFHNPRLSAHDEELVDFVDDTVTDAGDAKAGAEGTVNPTAGRC